MAIYISRPRKRKGKYHLWSSIVSDKSKEELVRFAKRMLLRKDHFEVDRYNISSRLYAEAVKEGAIEIDDSELDKYNCLK